MPIPLIRATARGCPACAQTVCKITTNREVMMVDWSQALMPGDSLVSVTHTVRYLSGYSVTSASLAVSGNTVYDDTTSLTLLIGGRAADESHEYEVYRVTASATTAAGETLTQDVQVRTLYVYENALTCHDERPVFNGSVFVVPSDSCVLQPPRICKAPGERRQISFDFSKWLTLPNGDTTTATGAHAVIDALASGYVTTNSLTMSGTTAYAPDGTTTGTTTTFSGGVANGPRGQCYYGYFRLLAAFGQWFYYPYTMQVMNAPSMNTGCVSLDQTEVYA